MRGPLIKGVCIGPLFLRGHGLAHGRDWRYIFLQGSTLKGMTGPTRPDTEVKWGLDEEHVLIEGG
jgi:hypothetical protein